MMRHYKLVHRVAVPCSLDEWAVMFEDAASRRVAVTNLDRLCVSTVFLGLDHRYSGDGPPILFETMVFVGNASLWQERCCSWAEAEVSHKMIASRCLALARESGHDGRGGRNKRTASAALLAMHLEGMDT